MEHFKLKLPYAFVSSRVALTWHDVRFAIDHELVDPRFAIQLARDRVAADPPLPTR